MKKKTLWIGVVLALMFFGALGIMSCCAAWHIKQAVESVPTKYPPGYHRSTLKGLACDPVPHKGYVRSVKLLKDGLYVVMIELQNEPKDLVYALTGDSGKYKLGAEVKLESWSVFNENNLKESFYLLEYVGIDDPRIGDDPAANHKTSGFSCDDVGKTRKIRILQSGPSE